MLLRQPFVGRVVARTRAQSARIGTLLADTAVLLGVFALLITTAQIGAGAFVHFHPPMDVPSVSLDWRYLPYYAVRSTLRMFIALGASLLFTLVYGYVAAKSRNAERVLIPLLDILQSVPVLGFLSVTVTGFIALFPGRLLGLEMASLFAIFTSQVWNMTFSFYQSLKTLPRDLEETVTLYRLPRWQRFTRLELPTAMLGLLWNAMMSFGGGWFFVAASEAISVLNKNYTLPGIGSYVATAVAAQNLPALLAALVTIAVVILTVDQLFWRPLVAWADKFKLERSASAEPAYSWMLAILRRSRLPRLIAQLLDPVSDAIGNQVARLLPMRPQQNPGQTKTALVDQLYNGALVVIVLGAALRGFAFIDNAVSTTEMMHTLFMALATLGRVILLTLISTLLWVPLGVAIGFNPRLARLVQPVVQFLASFPANFLFPFATLFFIRAGISLNVGSILLMALGAQWYILFNTIAGAMSIPNDLREMARNLGLRGWQRWRALIIPGIFSAWVTGGITAMGGAWNASIVSELVTWGNTTLTAYGIGAYIARATTSGDWPRIVLGVGLMSIFVVGLNRLLWRRLYQLAETKYKLG